MAVLRAANHRALLEGRVEGLPGGAWVRSRDELAAALRRGSPSGRWLLKRAFSYSGRGRCRLLDGAVDAHVENWVRASLAQGDGLRVEPEVDRTLDVALHGELDADGAVRFGALTRQRCDESGAWLGTELATDETLDEGELRALGEAAGATVRALREVGYRGPFGIDGYRWAGGFVPCCDVNARYTMGWSVGMSAKSCDALAAVMRAT